MEEFPWKTGVFSRDELSLDEEFEDILTAIRTGHFRPDDSRVMRSGESDINPEVLEARAGGIPLDDALNAAQIFFCIQQNAHLQSYRACI